MGTVPCPREPTVHGERPSLTILMCPWLYFYKNPGKKRLRNKTGPSSIHPNVTSKHLRSKRHHPDM